MKTILSLFVLIGHSVLFSSVILAEPLSLKWGAVDVVPRVGMDVIYDDDIFSDNTDVSSVVTVMNPSVKFVAQNKLDSYSLFYDLKSGAYASSSSDNYLDQLLDGRAHIELDNRNRIDVNLSYFDTHVERGNLESSVAVSEPDRYYVSTADFVYGYGLKALQGWTARIDVYGDISAKRYRNNLFQTARRELDSNILGATVFYRVAPKTEVLLELKQAAYKYKLSTSRNNNHEIFYLTGVTWKGGASSSGIVKIGGQKKRFNDGGKGSFRGATYEARILWEPKTYSRFMLMTQMKADEATGDEDYVEGVYSSISWTHSWKKRIKSTIKFSYDNEDVIENNQVKSVRKSTLMGVSLDYQFRRWLNLGFGYEFSGRTNKAVSQPLDPVYDRDFTRNQYSIKAQVVL